MSHPKILEHHLTRQAVIYIRQSSLLQVEQHTESRHRQYQLADRAQSLGWPPARCTIIDDDLGISGAHAHNRPGYQRLITMVALREVGIIFGLDVSRLARNSLDWYQLLELAGTFQVLIADEDGVYDPSDFNDRLLLGLKGTISEAELYQIRVRMIRGQRNKAQRGELVLRLPVGLEYDPLTQTIRLATDQSVQHVVELVFTRFRQLRSVRAVLHALVRDGVELPYQHVDRLGRTIAWRPPTYDALYLMLTNPSYAGVYCYGRRQRETDPLAKTTRYRRRRAREDWLVFIPDHHPGYITLAEFDTNQAILENNRMQHAYAQGAAGRGPALLQGLVVCDHCGQRMRVCYHRRVAYYVCDQAHRRRAAPICNRASAQRLDTLVEELLLSVVNQETLEVSVAYEEHLRAEAEVVERNWQEKLQRLSYQADLARRRYELVDPANRLVAQTLETEWNTRLLELEAARNAYTAQRLTPHELTSTREQIQEVITHLRDYWYAATITDQEKKEILRCLIVRVRLERQGPLIRAHVEWQGGAVTELDVPQYLFSSPAIYHRIRDLACSHTDTEIATILNAEGVTTAKGRVWSARHVMDFRRSNAIPSGFTTTSTLRLPESSYLTSAEAAERLGICQATVQKWYKLGVLTGRHAGGQAQLWIQWTDDLEERLSGRATPDPRMVSVRSLCHVQGKDPDEVLAWAQAQGHILYRLRRGTAMRFYVMPKPEGTTTPAPSAPVSIPEVRLEAVPDGAAVQEVTEPAATVAAVLTPTMRTIPDLCKELGMSKGALQALIAAHRDELLRQGVRMHVATKREVPIAIRLPSVLNPEEYTYYSKLSRPVPNDPVSGDAADGEGGRSRTPHQDDSSHRL